MCSYDVDVVLVHIGGSGCWWVLLVFVHLTGGFLWARVGWLRGFFLCFRFRRVQEVGGCCGVWVTLMCAVSIWVWLCDGVALYRFVGMGRGLQLGLSGRLLGFRGVS